MIFWDTEVALATIVVIALKVLELLVKLVVLLKHVVGGIVLEI